VFFQVFSKYTTALRELYSTFFDLAQMFNPPFLRRYILHMLKREDWEAAVEKGIYQPESIEKEGFIHCSLPDMLVTVANGLYLGLTDMIILVLDADKIEAPLVYEDCYETGHDFPHIYGSITPDCVIKIVDFPCDADGQFTLPAELA
jgi:uncharacterized protein (DUF952 family)